MPEKVVRWICECKKEHNTLSEAEVCEQKGFPVPVLRVGQDVLINDEIIRIDNVFMVVRGEPTDRLTHCIEVYYRVFGVDQDTENSYPYWGISEREMRRRKENRKNLPPPKRVHSRSYALKLWKLARTPID